MIARGELVPSVTVWIDPDDGSRGGISLGALAADGPFLLFFYLFDWTAT